MNERTEAVWIESDGVTNLPTEKGCYAMRSREDHHGQEFFAYFDGDVFFNSALSKKVATNHFRNGWHETATRGFFDAWRDYQGLMSKLAETSQPNGPVFSDEEEALIREMTSPVMASDEPGIARAAVKTDPPEDKTVAVVGGVTILASDLAAIIAARQPKPEVNTTPRGIMTVFNEAADHRLGMWVSQE